MQTGDGSMELTDTRTATLETHGANNSAPMIRLVPRTVPLMVYNSKTGKEFMETELQAMN